MSSQERLGSMELVGWLAAVGHSTRLSSCEGK
jgi:hypothetical protein